MAVPQGRAAVAEVRLTDKTGACDVSIIIPVLNEADCIAEGLSSAVERSVGTQVEILLIDGGSTDGTLTQASSYPVTTVTAPRGRASQMNAGAAVARGHYLVFLHIDTCLPENFADIVANWLAALPQWGVFNLRLSGEGGLFRLIERGINLRTRVSGTATGDQVFFCRADIFHDIGGFPDIALMEDVALSNQLKRISPPRLEAGQVVTSSRRWEQKGVCYTVAYMWTLRLAYICGVSPRHLSRWYYRET